MASSSCPSRSRPHALILSCSALASMLMSLLCALGASSAWAQGGGRSSAAPSAESLTQSLVGLAGINFRWNPRRSLGAPNPSEGIASGAGIKRARATERFRDKKMGRPPRSPL
jgi:hypothetical protein